MPSMFVQSTSSALIATSRTKFQGFRRSLATRNQPATSTPPATTPVHAYAHHNKKASQISVVALPFEPRPSKFTPPSRTWRFLKPVPAALPRLSAWSRSLHTQIPPSSLPKLLPPTLPPRSVQREGLLPAPLSIRKDSVQLGVRTSYHTMREQSTTGTEIMTKCVYVPWLIHGDSAESADWNAFLSNSVGHYHCKDLH